MIVTKIQRYFMYTVLYLLLNVNFVALSPINMDENTTKLSVENGENDIMKAAPTSNNLPVPLNLNTVPVVHREKRALDANQGSSWLKFVWRERKYKIPQMWLTNIRNLWAVDPAGGVHLFDAGVPYGSVFLIKTLVLDTVFPRIGKNQ